MFRLRFVRLLVDLLALSILLTSCRVINENNKQSNLALGVKSPSIQGIVIRVFKTTGEIDAIFVEDIETSDAAYDKATVRLTDNTNIFISHNDTYILTDTTALTIGLQVAVVFTGTILERYPVSAEAEEILILGK